MIIPEKVRAMNDAEKVHYYLKRLIDPALGENAKKDAVTMISSLMANTDINDIFNKFNLTGSIDTNKEPATITINVPDTEEKIVFDLTVSDRDQFADAHPEKNTRPVQSFLSEEEKAELPKTEESK